MPGGFIPLERLRALRRPSNLAAVCAFIYHTIHTLTLSLTLFLNVTLILTLVLKAYEPGRLEGCSPPPRLGQNRYFSTGKS